MTPVDTYSQPDAPDIVLAFDRVLELVRRHAPTVSAVLAVDESGGEARTYLCEPDVVLKTQRPHRQRPRTSLEKEAFILQELERDPSMLTPRLLGYGRERDVEYEVLTRVRGVALKDAEVTSSSRIEVLHQVGATLRRIHEVDQASMWQSGLIPGDDGPSDLAGRLSGTLEELRGELITAPGPFDENEIAEISAVILSGLPTNEPPVVLHSNPGAEHCFVDPETQKFSGLIDFGDSYRSHPALDIRSWRSPEDSQHMLDGYASKGQLSTGFVAVWRAGIVLTELRLSARGFRSAPDARRYIDRLLT